MSVLDLNVSAANDHAKADRCCAAQECSLVGACIMSALRISVGMLENFA